MPGGNKAYKKHKPETGNRNDKATILYIVVMGRKIIKN